MAEQKFTRCPGCKTIFRVTLQQLAMRGGQVRCGHCRTVFDGVASLVSLAPRAMSPGEEREFDEAALGPPTVTLRSAHALEPAPEAVGRSKGRSGEALLEEDEASSAAAEAAYAARFSWQQKGKRLWLPAWVYATAIPVLLLLLLAQALFHFRDAIAAHWPTTRPALIRLCAAAGCEVRPLQEIGSMSIEASDLQADPAHKGLLILNATLRNRAPYPVGYPYLELTLSDTQDQVVIRRAFAPSEYAGGTTNFDAGIPGNGELAVKLFIDASATKQAGYQVYLFYP